MFSYSRTPNSSSGSDSEQEDQIPPHCQITIRCTKEIAGFNGLSEAVRRLDFLSSVKDRRRFNYICALLGLIIGGKGIANLPGSAQRMLLQMIEEIASQVYDSQQNLNILRNLALQLKHIVDQENQKCWGKPLGSQNLWKRHVETIQRIQLLAKEIQISEVCYMSEQKNLQFPIIKMIKISIVCSRVLKYVPSCMTFQRNASEK